MMSPKIEKGALYLTLANAVFFITSYIIYFGLARILGSAAEFGLYGIVISLVAFIDGVLIAGMQQSVSKLVSEMPENAELVKRTALKLQLVVSFFVFIAYVAAAPLISALLNSPELTPYMQLSALMIFFHPASSIFMGYFNGLKRFARQANLLSTYCMARLFLILGFALLGFGIFGAVSGFVIASVFGMSLGYFLAHGSSRIYFITEKASAVQPSKDAHLKAQKVHVQLPKARQQASAWSILGFSAPLMAFAVLVNLLPNLDLYALKALAPQAVAGTLAGYYVGAQSIARVPYLLANSISLVVFPLVSSATFLRDGQKAGFYITSAFRYLLLATVPLGIFVVSAPADILAFVYPAEYAYAAAALSILSIGAVFFSVFSVLTSIMAASAKPAVAVLFSFLALLLSAALNLALVPIFLIDGAAIASAAAMVLVGIAATAYVFAKFSCRLPLLSMLRIAVAGAASFAVFQLWHAEGLMLVLKFLAFIAVYAGILFALREISKADIAVARNMVL